MVKLSAAPLVLTLTHEQFFDKETRDRHHGGWTGARDKLEKLVGPAPLRSNLRALEE